VRVIDAGDGEKAAASATMAKAEAPPIRVTR
jgi:hypothetical protein